MDNKINVLLIGTSEIIVNENNKFDFNIDVGIKML